MRTIVFFLLISACFQFTSAQVWSAVGNGVEGRVECFAVYNGELYVGGYFPVPGPQQGRGLLKWDGTNFVPVQGDSALGSYEVWSMVVYNNELVVAGSFCTYCNPVNAQFDIVARFNGTTWDSLENGLNGWVYALAEYNGNLILGGNFTSSRSGPQKGVVKWDGSQLQSMQGGIPSLGGVHIFDLVVFQNELYATGNFITSPSNSVCIQRWNDTTWSDAGPGGINGVIYALTNYANGLYVGGPYFTLAGGVPVTHMARWDGTTYSPVGSGFGFGPDFGQMSCLATYQGKLFASGEFLSIDGVPCRSIGQFDGVSWDSVGTGADSVGIVVDSIPMGPFGGWYYIHAPATISAMIEFGGELYVGGIFNMVGGVQARNVAKWAGTVAAEEGISAPEAVVFPNPVDEWLSIEQLPLADPFVLEVLDAAGKLVLSRSAYQGEAIPTTQFADGIYLLRLLGAEQPIHRTFLVRH